MIIYDDDDHHNYIHGVNNLLFVPQRQTDHHHYPFRMWNSFFIRKLDSNMYSWRPVLSCCWNCLLFYRVWFWMFFNETMWHVTLNTAHLTELAKKGFHRLRTQLQKHLFEYFISIQIKLCYGVQTKVYQFEYLISIESVPGRPLCWPISKSIDKQLTHLPLFKAQAIVKLV